VDRGAVLVLRGSVNVRVPVNLESVACVPAPVTFSLCPLKRRMRLGHLCLCFMGVLYVGAVAGSTLSDSLRDWLSQCPSRVCVHILCMCLSPR